MEILGVGRHCFLQPSFQEAALKPETCVPLLASPTVEGWCTKFEYQNWYGTSLLLENAVALYAVWRCTVRCLRSQIDHSFSPMRNQDFPHSYHKPQLPCLPRSRIRTQTWKIIGIEVSKLLWFDLAQFKKSISTRHGHHQRRKAHKSDGHHFCVATHFCIGYIPLVYSRLQSEPVKRRAHLIRNWNGTMFHLFGWMGNP